ncbi:TlpA family protein disulfide reductase [Candidatus Peregrinibacteria bacterium]|nr:TlpA family protein disulfide reductase [Candidatus Peregrinibacteria bacterium]
MEPLTPFGIPYWTRWLIIAKLLFLVRPASAITVGERAPDFVAEDVSGDTVHLNDVLKEKVVILYFWDVRFFSCHQGLQELRKLHAKYPNQLTILAVNIDPSARSELQNFIRDQPWDEAIGKLLLNRGGTAQRYDAELSVPVSCIIDQDSRVRFYEQSFDKKKLKQAVKDLLRRDSWKGLWGQYLLTTDALNGMDDLDDGDTYFRWGRGDVFSLAFLREGRKQWTLGVQASFSYQNPTEYKSKYSHSMGEVVSGSATLSFGPPPLWRHFSISLSGGVAGYERLDEDAESEIGSRSRTSPNPIQETVKRSTHIIPVADLNVRLYIIDSISLYASGGVDLDAIASALDNVESVLQEEHVYHYEAGIRASITRHSHLNVGYGQWRLGDRNVKGLQIAYGYTF